MSRDVKRRQEMSSGGIANMGEGLTSPPPPMCGNCSELELKHLEHSSFRSSLLTQSNHSQPRTGFPASTSLSIHMFSILRLQRIQYIATTAYPLYYCAYSVSSILRLQRIQYIAPTAYPVYCDYSIFSRLRPQHIHYIATTAHPIYFDSGILSTLRPLNFQYIRRDTWTPFSI